jgi:hypothetical protein
MYPRQAGVAVAAARLGGPGGGYWRSEMVLVRRPGNHLLWMMTAVTWMKFSHQFPAVNGRLIGAVVSSEAVLLQVNDATWT